MGRIVGIDPGEVRVGVAISDESQTIAFPRDTIETGRTADDTVRKIVSSLSGEDIAGIVVGLPLRLDGTEGEAARRARVLGKTLSGAFAAEVRYWDERMTTLAAERSLRDLGTSRSKKRSIVDRSAATILLQSYLDAKKNETWNRDGLKE